MRQFTRLRSLLFAPAVRPDFVAKLADRGADAVVIDCEDATPANAKAEGRANAAALAGDVAANGTQVTVRVNAEPTKWFADDVRDALTGALTAVVVPKIETMAGLDRVASALDEAGHGQLGVIAGIETALGVADARVLLAHTRVVAGYFGAEDFIADMAGVRTPGNAEVHYARSAVALAGRLAGVPVLDQIVADFRDDVRFRHEAAEARSMGYVGKLCIHPGQVPLANDAFVPSADEVDRARRLLEAYDTASAGGVAAIDFEGQMVDEPLATQARRIIALADRP
ncbi:HpcH/HpaI aldolase/citrate lyase family protein [Ilumatobacter sp.]|uniref:HpcH/HpaI aldolase/citrate lyase family protein n=1 Tax=Ilumatobacter sp. TaxID=1967498 RepID=UPI003AF919C2